MTICPCCGFKFEGALSTGCEACGARSVGEPLPKPAHELPSYARSLLLAVIGPLMVVAFLTQSIIALTKPATLSFDFWSLLAAGQTAAWRLKWVAIPTTILVLWGSRRIYRSMMQSPARFCGLRYAKTGLIATAFVPVLIAVLIVVTIPERLHQRELGIRAGENAIGYATDRALLQYLKEFGTFPSEKKDLARLPDPDGSIAALLRQIEASEYKASAEVAAVPSKKPRALGGAVIRNASLNTASDEPLSEGLSFTNYEIRLAGADKVLDTDDDLIVRDGIITKASESSKPPVSSAASAKTDKR